MAYLSFEQLNTHGGVRTGSVFTIPANATSAELQADDGADVRYTMDGSTDPSASSGMILQTGGAPKEFLIEDVTNIRFISSGAQTSINIHYFGGRDI